MQVFFRLWIYLTGFYRNDHFYYQDQILKRSLISDYQNWPFGWGDRHGFFLESIAVLLRLGWLFVLIFLSYLLFTQLLYRHFSESIWLILLVVVLFLRRRELRTFFNHRVGGSARDFFLGVMTTRPIRYLICSFCWLLVAISLYYGFNFVRIGGDSYILPGQMELQEKSFIEILPADAMVFTMPKKEDKFKAKISYFSSDQVLVKVDFTVDSYSLLESFVKNGSNNPKNWGTFLSLSLELSNYLEKIREAKMLDYGFYLEIDVGLLHLSKPEMEKVLKENLEKKLAEKDFIVVDLLINEIKYY